MYFDFKVTIWDRVTVPEEHEKQIIKSIQSGEITSVQGIFDFLDKKSAEPTREYLYETDSQIAPEENDGAATIEILDNKKSIWSNDITQERQFEKITVEVRGGIAYCDDPRVVIVDHDNDQKG